MTVVLDASAVLAVIFGERGAERVQPHLASDGLISSVNLSEVASRLVEADYSDEDARITLNDLSTLVRSFEADTAIAAGLMRRTTRSRGLSLGDRACIALAQECDAPILTADRIWTKLDLGVEIEVIR